MFRIPKSTELPRSLGRILAGLALLVLYPVFALGEAGRPTPGDIGFQEPATIVMENIRVFHNVWLLPMSVIIVVIVLALMLWVMIRYNEKANPTPKKFSHNTLVEIVWTAIPVVILLAIVAPSMRLLFLQDRIPPVDLTIKTIGNQWNWDYEYPDHGDFTFNAVVENRGETAEERASADPERPVLLATDLPMVIPAGKTVRLLVTASDVIHSWAVPSFGVKIDAVPGTTNETWFRVDREGTYFGQCSELCGTDHAYMPIEVKVVSPEEFSVWVKQMQQEYAATDIPSRVRLASVKANSATIAINENTTSGK